MPTPQQSAMADALRSKSGGSLEGMFDYQRAQQAGPITDVGQFDDLLANLRKYDPNARFEYRDNSGSSNEGGNATPNSYELVFDQGKLPNAGGSRKGESMPAFNSAGQAQGIQQLGAGEGFRRPELFKPDAHWNSDYGDITDSRNVNTITGSDSLWQYAPAVIAAIATMGAAAPALAGAAGAGAGAAGASAPGWLVNGFTGALNSASQGNAGGVGGAALGALGGAFGIPSWATGLGRMALSQALQSRARKGGG